MMLWRLRGRGIRKGKGGIVKRMGIRGVIIWGASKNVLIGRVRER